MVSESSLVFSLAVAVAGILGHAAHTEPIYGDYCGARMPSAAAYEAEPWLELQHVHLFHRHGDRSAIAVLPSPYETDVEWFDCASNQTSEPGTATPYKPEWDMPKQRSPWQQQLWTGNCFPGRLTVKGAFQHRRLGAILRTIYVDKLGFLPDTLDLVSNKSLLQVRSTDVRRVIESVENNLLALYPRDKRVRAHGGEPAAIPITIFPKEIETLVYQDRSGYCPALTRAVADMKASPQWLANMPNQTVAKLQRVVKGMEHWELWQMFDAMRGRQCHAKSLPCNARGECMTLDDLAPLWAWGDWSFDYQYRVFAKHTMRSLGIGPLFSQLLESYDALYANGFQTKWSHFSAHDTSLGPILGALDVEIPWIPLASNLLWETWGDANGNSYMRVIFNGRVLSLPFCSRGSLCTWAEFRSHLATYVPHDLATACHASEHR